jgi:hypothetical protein
MITGKPYEQLLLRDGTSRLKRRATVLLNKNYVNIDERSMEDLVQFAIDFAEQVNFFNEQLTIDGNWKHFFQQGLNLADLKKSIDSRSDFHPQFALYLVFIKLFGFAQNQLNGLTQQHLDFYYEHVLDLHQLKAEPDKVHVVYELAKGASEFFSAKNTLFDAGKDASTKLPLQYSADDDTLINTATIADKRTIYLSPAENDVVRFASVANSPDGLGAKPDPTKPWWKAFGGNHLSSTKIGFALASPLLLLKEGTREVTITIQLSGLAQSLQTITSINGEKLEVFYTGKKNWIGPFEASVTPVNNFSGGNQSITIKHGLGADDEEVVRYDGIIHGQSFNTVWPVMQLKADTTNTGNLFGALRSTTVNKVKIEVKVNGVAGLRLENDQGVVDAKKPFQPFGSQPKKGSSFYVGFDEVLHKNLDTFSFDVTWLAPPISLKNHYSNYKVPPATSIDSNNYFRADYFIKNSTARNGETNLFDPDNAESAVSWPDTSSPSGLFSFYPWLNTYFISTYNSYHSLISNPNLYIAGFFGYNFNLVSAVAKKTILPVSPEKGFIRFELQKDFLHNIYPQVLAAAMSGWEPKTADTLPKEPYTPTIKTIRFNYTASSTEIIPSSESFGDFNRKEIQLFHLGVFGQAEQHGYLKTETARLFGPTVPFNKSIYLFPSYTNEGNFLFSLTGALPGQSVSFLFQLAEGTANPEKEAVNIQWFALSNNEWRKLKQTEILKDETNHLLRSGIIRLVIPAEATTDNSLFDAGKIWLCAVVEKDVDAVCLFNDVLPQAVTATFKADANSSSLHQSPAGTISKLVNKVVEIKKLNQPYASFGGKAVESKDDFYLRVSERLRHKQRAVDLWDYEHIVLQEFPEVYKVKCLNHSVLPADCACDFVKPGHITLVVVPDVRNKNQFSPLEPKVSLDLITRIEEYLKELCSFFVTPQVKNPVYEQVKLQFKIRFTTEGDFGFYADLLNNDLIKYLTPWAYSTDTDIVFGGHIRKSVLLNFIEELSYVDFVTEFNMYHIVNGAQGADTDEIKINNPAAILVSHNQHLITAYQETEVCV